jgi:SAM-dependent methyltransferase
MAKLTGDRYLDYWRARMAKGPDQAGFDGRDADRQGDDIWKFIKPWISRMDPGSVLDFGCGYGRFLRKMHSLWPKAKLHGVDLCPEAIEHIARDSNWFDCGKPKLSTSIPARLKVDLVFDCLALQHVTDDGMLKKTVADFGRILKPGGRFVLFENIASPGADHVRDMTAAEYMALWPEPQWLDCGMLMLGSQEHALLIGRKC